ncbi:MAG: BrnT family toxin [Nitrospirae bacterium]|nr:BrnT family toxin [Nitrospirota bacterium]
MRFEWDPAKSATNNAKHGIDFETAKELWRDEKRVEIHVPYPDEERFIIVGKLKNKHWTAVYTMRDAKIRIISVRRSREKEMLLYDNENGG